VIQAEYPESIASQRKVINQSPRFVTELFYAPTGRELELLCLEAMNISVAYLTANIKEPELFKGFGLSQLSFVPLK
jgi:hypothetical protein